MLFQQMIHFILLLLQIVSVLYSLKKTKYDLALPSNILMISLIVGYAFYALGYELWNHNMENNTAFVYFFFFAIMVVCSLVFSNKHIKTIHEVKLPKYRNVSMLFCICIIFFLLYTMGLLIVGNRNGLGFFSAINYVKNHRGSMNPVIRQGFKVVTCSAKASILLLVIGINKHFYTWKYRVMLITMIVLGCVITIFSGSRGDILKILSCFFLFYFLNRGGQGRKDFYKVIKKTMPITISVIIVFYFARLVVKNASVATGALDFIDYINFYFGSPIEVLNIKLHNVQYYRNGYFGSNVFYDLYHDLIDVGIIDNARISWSNAFVYIGNFDFGGNVATIIFPFVCDFGYLGGIIALSLIVIMGNRRYIRLKKSGSSLKILLFGYIYSIYVFAFYDSVVYQIFSLTGLFEIIVLISIYWLLYKVNFINGSAS